MSILENIRNIAVFMIAAQTAMHFAAGKQYEKYMKVITGVIILFMFIGPFLSAPQSLAVNWQEEIIRMENRLGDSMRLEMPYAADSVETTALRQIEEEVRVRLNDAIPDEDYTVTDVAIDLEKKDESIDTGTGGKERNWVFRRVKVIMQAEADRSIADTYGRETIVIGEIKIGHESENEAEQEEQDSGQETKMREYRHIFAQMLGIAEDRVEVTYRGGR